MLTDPPKLAALQAVFTQILTQYVFEMFSKLPSRDSHGVVLNAFFNDL